MIAFLNEPNLSAWPPAPEPQAYVVTPTAGTVYAVGSAVAVTWYNFTSSNVSWSRGSVALLDIHTIHTMRENLWVGLKGVQYCLFLGFQAFTIFFFYHSQLNFSLSSSSSSSLSISLLYYLVLGMIIIPRYLQVWLKMYLCNQTVTQCLVVTPLLDAQISNTGSYNFVISPCKQSPPRLNKHELSCSIVFLSFFLLLSCLFFFCLALPIKSFTNLIWT